MTKSVKRKKDLRPIEKWLLTAGFIALVISAFGVGYLLSTYQAISSSIPNNAEEKAKYSESHINNSVRALAFEKNITTSKYQQAKDKDADTKNTYIKDKRDLYAQEGMWKVATELLWITTIQLFVFIVSIIASIAALIFLYDTLSATRKTLNAARKANEIARSANRAWCNFALSRHAVGVRGENREHTFSYRVVNAGNSPANNIRQDFAVLDKDQFRIAIDQGTDSVNTLITKASPKTHENGFLFHSTGVEISDIAVEIAEDRFFKDHALSKRAQYDFAGIDSFESIFLVARLSYSPYSMSVMTSVIKVYELTFIENDGWSAPKGHKAQSTFRIKEITNMQMTGEK